jgi:type II secretion system protein G
MPCKPRPLPSSAFTLIELLIVVAIIAILAGIALPNFLEAQTRAKVSRALADMRSLTTAIETYRIDNNQYPAENYPSPLLVPEGGLPSIPNRIKLRVLTTPVAYITALPTDPFASLNDPLNMLPPPTYHYVSINDPLYPDRTPFYLGDNPEHRQFAWMIQSDGPDRSPLPWQYPRYDATNGTLSEGNILTQGP